MLNSLYTCITRFIDEMLIWIIHSSNVFFMKSMQSWENID